MTPETFTYPTQAEIDAIRLRARQMQAEAISAAFRAVFRWIAHPTLRLRHA